MQYLSHIFMGKVGISVRTVKEMLNFIVLKQQKKKIFINVRVVIKK